MPGSKFDALDTKFIAEGRYAEVATNRLVYGNNPGHGYPTFLKIVILEVISDPSTLDDTKISYYVNELGLTNVDAVRSAPRNSVIGRRIMAPDCGASESVMVWYPFFPPSMSFPAKPGEHVWAILENPDAKSNDIGYWMCKIVQPNFVEDVNYTHADRQFEKSFFPGLANSFTGNTTPVYEFRNGVVDYLQDQRYTNPDTVSLPGDDDTYKNILTESDACYVTWYEPVPRYKKRPADTAFEGSNNTLIVLGTDRTGAIATYKSDPTYGQEPSIPDADIFTDGAGMIDIVAGRGQTSATAGTSVDNKIIGKELAKHPTSVVPNEGDPDLVHDRSRLLVVQQSNVDINFNLDSFFTTGLWRGKMSDPSVKSTGGVVLKSDRVRIIGRSSVALVTTGQGARDANGMLIDNDNNDNWATIGIKSSGDVYMQPIKGGTIDLETTSCNIMVNDDNIDIATKGVDVAISADEMKTTVGGTIVDVTGSSVAFTVPALNVNGSCIVGNSSGAIEQIISALSSLALALAAAVQTGSPTDGSAAMTLLAAAGKSLSSAVMPLKSVK